MPSLSRLRIQDLHVPAILQTCCDLRLPALVMSPSPGESTKARFVSATKDLVTLELAADEQTPLRASSACVVTYLFDGKVFLFLSVVRGYSEQHPSGPRLSIALPDNIAVADLRSAVRISVPEDCGLHAEVEVSMYATERSRVLDISRTGIMVEYDPDAKPDLAEGDIAKIHLKLGSRTAEYAAELRHVNGGRCGFMFIAPDEPLLAVEQEDALLGILEEIDSRTILRRLGADRS